MANLAEKRRDLGDWLRLQREALTLSQEEAAQRIGVSRVQYNRWERGRSTPDPDACEKIAVGFGLPIREVLMHAGYWPAGAEEVSPWAHGLARRIERTADGMPPQTRRLFERTLDSLLALQGSGRDA